MRVAPTSVLSNGWHRFVDHDWTIISDRGVQKLPGWSDSDYGKFLGTPSRYLKCADGIAALLSESKAMSFAVGSTV